MKIRGAKSRLAEFTPPFKGLVLGLSGFLTLLFVALMQFSKQTIAVTSSVSLYQPVFSQDPRNNSCYPLTVAQVPKASIINSYFVNWSSRSIHEATYTTLLRSHRCLQLLLSTPALLTGLLEGSAKQLMLPACGRIGCLTTFSTKYNCSERSSIWYKSLDHQTCPQFLTSTILYSSAT